MFRWNLMLEALFGSRREQPKVRRPKERVKLHLEALEDRTLPSGSPLPIEYVASPPPVPPVAALTSYVESTLNQWTQFVVMVQQEVLSYYQGLIQEIAQVESAFVQEADHLFGINPNTSNPSFNTVVSQPGNGVGRGNNSGSGSGGSAAATRNAPNQPSNNSTQQSGNGSGSGSSSTTTTHGNSPRNTLHPMTGSGGSGSGTGSATAYGNVWLDNDSDGSWDNNEFGYLGATVQLINATTGQPELSTTTNGAGYYQFKFQEDPIGHDYEIHVVFPSYFGATIAGGQSQIDANGYSFVFHLAAGGAQQVKAGIRSMNVNIADDDPNGPKQQNTVYLRDAIKAGNTGFGPTVTFITDPQNGTQLGGNIPLAKALDPIEMSYNINGPGASTLKVSGSGNVNNPFRDFDVNSGVTSTISGLAIVSGFVTGTSVGAGIRNQGNLTLNADTLRNNQSMSGGGAIYNAYGAKLQLQSVTITAANIAIGAGGGLENWGTVTISGNTTISNNFATQGGGGIFNHSGGTVNATGNTQITGNQDTNTGVGGGGGVANSGTFTMKKGSISNNSTTKNGGGVANVSGGKMTLSSVAIQSNKATTQNSSVGGGIYVLSGAVTLKKDTIGGGAKAAGNTALAGGGIWISAGTVKITGGSIANNSASGNGGGIFNKAGSLTIQISNGIPGVNVTANDAGGVGGGMYFGVASTTTFNLGAPVCTISGNTLGGVPNATAGAGAYQQQAGGKLAGVDNWTPGTNPIDNDDGPNRLPIKGP